MRAVYQTNFAFGSGDCFRASVASILELPLECVPNFCEGNNPKWWDDFAHWLRSYRLLAVSFPGPDWCSIVEGRWTGEIPENLKVIVYEDALAPRGYTILSGKSPRGPYLHSVVAFNGEVVHDPFPPGGGVETKHDWIIFYPMDPAEVRLPRPE